MSIEKFPALVLSGKAIMLQHLAGLKVNFSVHLQSLASKIFPLANW